MWDVDERKFALGTIFSRRLFFTYAPPPSFFCGEQMRRRLQPISLQIQRWMQPNNLIINKIINLSNNYLRHDQDKKEWTSSTVPLVRREVEDEGDFISGRVWGLVRHFVGLPWQALLLTCQDRRDDFHLPWPNKSFIFRSGIDQSHERGITKSKLREIVADLPKRSSLILN